MSGNSYDEVNKVIQKSCQTIEKMLQCGDFAHAAELIRSVAELIQASKSHL